MFVLHRTNCLHWKFAIVYNQMAIKVYFDTRRKCKTAMCDLGQHICTALKWTRSLCFGTQATSVKIHFFVCVSMRLPWSPVVMWLKGLCHPVVQPHSFECRTLGPAHRDWVKVWLLLLLSVTASLVGAAGGAYALCRRSSQLGSSGCGAGSGEMRVRVAESLPHKPWLN